MLFFSHITSLIYKIIIVCVCVSVTLLQGLIILLFRWYNEIISNDLSLGQYTIVTGSESKMVITCKRVGGFDKQVNHM